MERNSLIYRLRRKCQVIAHHFVSDETMSKLYFRIVLGKKLNLVEPQTFNEKIQWMKLYYFPNDSLAIIGADKYKVREYISQKGLADKLIPLYGVWSRAEEINWESLPDKFVLKCNHGCAYNIVVDNKNESDKSLIVRQLNKWLKEDFGAFNIEPHYSAIHPHRIICEEYLGAKITDYKFFCFNGKPLYMYVSNDLERFSIQ